MDISYFCNCGAGDGCSLSSLFFCAACHGLRCERGSCTSLAPTSAALCTNCGRGVERAGGGACTSCSLCPRCKSRCSSDATICDSCGWTRGVRATHATASLAAVAALLRRSAGLRRAARSSSVSAPVHTRWLASNVETGVIVSDDCDPLLGSAASPLIAYQSVLARLPPLPLPHPAPHLRKIPILAASTTAGENFSEKNHHWAGIGDDALPATRRAEDERLRLLTARAAGFGPPSAGPAAAAALDAAAARACEELMPMSAAEKAPFELRCLAALQARRATCASVLLLSDDAFEREANGADASAEEDWQPSPLRTLHTRRCRACVARGLPGILTAPNAAAISPGNVLPDLALSAWFRKTSPASALLPRLRLLAPPPYNASSGSGGRSDGTGGGVASGDVSVDDVDVDVGCEVDDDVREARVLAQHLRTHLQAAVAAAAAAILQPDGIAPTHVTLRVPVLVEIVNPSDVGPALAALVASAADASLDSTRARGSHTDDADSGDAVVYVPMRLNFVGATAPEPLPPSSGGVAAALAAAVSTAATPPVTAVVASVASFDDLRLDEPPAAANEAVAAAAADAAELLGSGGGGGGGDGGDSQSSTLAGISPAAEYRRWQHVVLLRAEASLRVPAAALAPAMPPPLAWRCVLDVDSAAAVFLLSAPALAHKVGASEPSPAALAAGRCVTVRLAASVDVPGGRA